MSRSSLNVMSSFEEIYLNLLPEWRERNLTTWNLNPYDEAICLHFLKRSLEIVSLAAALTIEMTEVERDIPINEGHSAIILDRVKEISNRYGLNILPRGFDVATSREESIAADRAVFNMLSDQLPMYKVTHPEDATTAIMTLIRDCAFDEFRKVMKRMRGEED